MIKYKSLLESIIDFAKEKLPTNVWIKDGENYTINPQVKKKVYNVMGEYPDLNLKDIAKEIRIVGSIGTNQFLDDADIDVHIVPDLSKLPGMKNPEEWVRDVFKWYKQNRKQADAFIDKHPIEFYLQLVPEQDLMSDSVFDLEKEEWVVGPGIMPMAFDPYEKFKDLIDTVGEVVGGIDKLMGELKRDVIDYSFIKRAVTEMPPEVRKQLVLKLKEKLEEMEEDIQALMKEKKDILLMRKNSSTPTSADQALGDMEYIKNWKDANVVFKFVNRYQYLRLINDLEDIMEDDKVTDKEVDKLGKILNTETK